MKYVIHVIIKGLPLLFLFSFGCSKTKNNTVTSQKSNTDYLTASSWYVTNYQEDNGIDGSIDYTNDPATCNLDDTYTFGKNNILTYDPGASTCDSADSKSTTTWALTSKDTVLTFSGASYYINALNDTLLSIFYDSTDSGTKYRVYYNFKH
jgi:hypothetical protein